MENFDELMRQKYNNDDPAGRFEFREEYWEQAKALIEADEARRLKWRRRLRWWAFATALLLCAGAGWWMTADDGRQTADGGWLTTHGARRTADTVGTMADGGQHTAHGEWHTADSVGSMANGTQQTAHDAWRTEDSVGTMADSGRHTADNNKTKTGVENAGLTGKKHQQPDLTIHNTTSKTISQSKKTISKDNGNNRKSGTKTIPDNATGTPPESGRSNKGTSTDNPSLVVESLIRENYTAPSKTEVLQAQQTAVGAVSTSVPDAADTSKILNAAEENPIKTLGKFLEQLFTLPLPFPPASSTNTRTIKTPEKPLSPPMATQLEPVSNRQFSFGVSAAAVAFQRAPDRRWLGFSGAAYGAYEISQRWSASLGLGLRYQPGNWYDTSGVVLTESKLFSFGFTATSSERRAAGLLSLEIPIAAAWHSGQLALEGGIAPGRLLYNLDRYKETRESSLKPKETVKNRLEKGDVTQLGKSYINTFVGAEWRLSRNTSLAMRGNYRLGNIVNATVEDPAIRGGLSLDIGLRLKLF